MHDMYNAARLMMVVFSDCTGVPFRRLRVNTQLRTKWDTGVFSSVTLNCMGGKPGLITSGEDGLGPDFDLRFEVQCMKPGDSSASMAAVNLHLHDSYGGLWTTIAVDCPPEVFEDVDLDLGSIVLYECEKDDDYPGEHEVYSEKERPESSGPTLVEDLPHCRELVGRLCRELTAQLWKQGYFLRPVEACPDLG